MVLGFSVVLPVGGYTGWSLIQRTADKQKATLQKSPIVARDLAYFKANIGKANTPEKFMADYRLRSFVMTAYRLDDSINYKGMIQKAISQSTSDKTSFVNKYSDKRWSEMATALGYGDTADKNPASQASQTAMTTKLSSPAFQDQIVKKYVETQWQVSVGDADSDIETALYVQQRLPAMASQPKIDKSGWYTVIGETSLRKIFQTTFGFPDSFVNLDVDKQVQMYQKAATKLFGNATLSQFSDPKKVTKLIQHFFAMQSIQGNASAIANNTAVSLLSNLSGPSSGNNTSDMSGLFQSIFSAKTSA